MTWCSSNRLVSYAREPCLVHLLKNFRKAAEGVALAELNEQGYGVTDIAAMVSLCHSDFTKVFHDCPPNALLVMVLVLGLL